MPTNRRVAALKNFQKGMARQATSQTSTPDTQQHLAAALQAHQMGLIDRAKAGYEYVLSLAPNNADALHLLGVIYHQSGDSARGSGLIRRAVDINPNHHGAWNNLGNALHDASDFAEASKAYRTALKLTPGRADYWVNLGNNLTKAKDFVEAEASYDRALKIDPSLTQTLLSRGNLYLAWEKYDQAVADIQSYLSSHPESNEARLSLAVAFVEQKEYQPAVETLQEVLARDPNEARALNNLGMIALIDEQFDQAIEYLHAANVAKPHDSQTIRNLVQALTYRDMEGAKVGALHLVGLPTATPEDWFSFGKICRHLHQKDEMFGAFEKAISLSNTVSESLFHVAAAYLDDGQLEKGEELLATMLKAFPDHAEAIEVRALIAKDAGELQKAIKDFKKVIRLQPGNVAAHSNYLLTLTYSPDHSAQDQLAAAKEWAEQHTPVVPERPALKPIRGRKIRIGYLSADFHSHPAGYIYEELFSHHDRSKFEIGMYLNQSWGDAVTERTVQGADRWSIVRYMTNDELVAQIQRDGVDILIDLLGHTNNHRLTAFGQRPAPIQATWLGYFGTTGMQQMDYILCDQYTIPVHEEADYTEAPARIEQCMYVQQIPKVKIKPNKLPMDKNGFVTYGCFNNLAKITDEVIDLWSEVLKNDPTSRLVLKRYPYQNTSIVARYAAMFAANGIDPSRVTMEPTKGRQAYFEAYHEVDVMLDTFPFGGGTTTLEALWMGVPVVSLPAPRFSGHMTESLVRCVGVDEILVTDRAGFLSKALSLPADTAELRRFRKETRAKAEASLIYDMAGFAQRLESTFDWMICEAA